MTRLYGQLRSTINGRVAGHQLIGFLSMLCVSALSRCRYLPVSAISASLSLPNRLPPLVRSLNLPSAEVSGFSSDREGVIRFSSSRTVFSLKPSFYSSTADTEMAGKTSIHEFTVKDARANDVDLSIYKGKVLLIVNVASQCGLTNSNYTELSQLYEKYKDKGFEVLAFPCNQFGGQEPGTNEDIVEFACTRFKAEYPIFDKVDVNGQNAAPIYKFLKSNKGGLFGDNIKWNFAKFLVDQDGNVVDRYAPTTSPLSIEKDVKKLLGVS